ncbi:MAG: hypothetical protein IJS13_06805 [Paludibacteraceae bacterium]|nr:hypothetical protein [Paludibacteraceae bacterium]MBR1809547.1 hypothetical protein [Paludibacteraceae bacterium]
MMTKANRQKIYEWIRSNKGKSGAFMETKWVSTTDYNNIRQRINITYNYATYETIERKGDKVRMRILIK